MLSRAAGPKIGAGFEMVAALKIPRPFLRKLYKRLARKAYSILKGQAGGFALAKNPAEID